MKLNDLVQRVKAHPQIADSQVGKIADDNFAHVVGQLSFDVLQDLGEEAGRDFGPKRNYTFTDPTTAIVALGGDGSADLTTLVAQSGLLLENLHFGEIRHPDSSYPLRRVGTVAELTLPSNYQAIEFRYAIIGTTIKTAGADPGTPLAGDLSFACPHINGLDDLNPQLEDELVEGVVLRLKGLFTLEEHRDVPAE